ncbi:putative Zn-dependent metalloprotease [Candidatus Bealeia paramacronuclearis]|uniref:Zn-dependent metalloprotease n=1 Tax=Candidatus Bealeia paramacronuclearis TaxID=1921001 RepID=A0ABZ2C2S5_9PROT|nr:putative Zn-dependent metalloprotease [Candidatus Bealeia paramacronuclearis]
MKIKNRSFFFLLTATTVLSCQASASIVHVINTTGDTVRVFFRGEHSPNQHTEVLPAKTASVFAIEKTTISHKPVFQAIGASCYGGGPDWKLVNTHCGTLHKDKNYVVQIEESGIGGLKTICTELATSI